MVFLNLRCGARLSSPGPTQPIFASTRERFRVIFRGNSSFFRKNSSFQSFSRWASSENFDQMTIDSHVGFSTQLGLIRKRVADQDRWFLWLSASVIRKFLLYAARMFQHLHLSQREVKFEICIEYSHIRLTNIKISDRMDVEYGFLVSHFHDKWSAKNLKRVVV